MCPKHIEKDDEESLLRQANTHGYEGEDLHLGSLKTVHNLGHEDLEGVEIIGRPLYICNGLDDDDYSFMKKFYKDPVPQVLEVKEMSSVLCETPYAFYGNSVTLDWFYATGCVMISVKPMESRERLSL